MNTFRDVIAAMGGPIELARQIDGNAYTAISWKQRNTIPATKWARVVDAAKRAGVSGVTFEALARMAEETKRQTDAA